MAEFNGKLCDEKHMNIERRIGELEDTWKENLPRIYDKLEEAMKRLPVWVTVVISVLTATCSGLIVAMVRH